MVDEYVWIIGFDKESGIRKNFTCCPKNNARFYEELYIGDGYDVKILTGKELDDLIETENKGQ